MAISAACCISDYDSDIIDSSIVSIMIDIDCITNYDSYIINPNANQDITILLSYIANETQNFYLTHFAI